MFAPINIEEIAAQVGDTEEKIAKVVEAINRPATPKAPKGFCPRCGDRPRPYRKRLCDHCKSEAVSLRHQVAALKRELAAIQVEHTLVTTPADQLSAALHAIEGKRARGWRRKANELELELTRRGWEAAWAAEESRAATQVGPVHSELT